MDMQAYKKEMISYIKSLSAQELESAIIAAGAKKTGTETLKIKNIPVEEFDNDIKYNLNYSTDEPIEVAFEVCDGSIEINSELLIDGQNDIYNSHEYREVA